MKATLGWFGIIRLGLVQTALGAIVVLTTSTLNRVMVVELALPAVLPGALVGLHYAIQISRPRWGYGSDVGGRCTPWILGGMAVLAVGGVGAALATAWMASTTVGGIVLAALSFTMIGMGVGAAGTSLLVLLAKRVEEHRRGAAATIVWTMMITGFVVTASTAGHLLDPYSPTRLITITAAVSMIALAVTIAALWGVEGRATPRPANGDGATQPAASFRTALAQVWGEPHGRRFAIFVFISMLAYSAQDLILEPFAGSVMGFTPGETTKLSGLQHAGVLAGMILVGLASGSVRLLRIASLRSWMIGGCIASALSLLALAASASVGPSWPLRLTVFVLGLTNGAYAVAAIGSMMSLVGSGRKSREGVRMGLWGAAQAIAFGLGGFAGALASDIARLILGSPAAAYASVFVAEAGLFLVAAVLAMRITRDRAQTALPSSAPRRNALIVAGNLE